METKTYTGVLGGPGGFDGYAGLVIGQSYSGEKKTVTTEPTEEGEEAVTTTRIHILLPNGRPTSVSQEQWKDWFQK
jgi:hypothetical protein